jgi:hypothetical protein
MTTRPHTQQLGISGGRSSTNYTLITTALLQTLAVRIETNCNKTSLGRTYNNGLLGTVVERVRCLAETGLVVLTGTRETSNPLGSPCIGAH